VSNTKVQNAMLVNNLTYTNRGTSWQIGQWASCAGGGTWDLTDETVFLKGFRHHTKGRFICRLRSLEVVSARYCGVKG